MTAAAATAEVPAPRLSNGTGPRRRSALPACEATFAISTHFVTLADALKGLCLSWAVGAQALVRTTLPLLLAEVATGGPPCVRTVTCSQLPPPFSPLPIANVTLGWSIVAFSPHVGAVEIALYALGTAMRQLLATAFGPPAEVFARVTASARRAVEFLLAHRITVLDALAVFDVVLPCPAGNVCPVKVVIPVDIDVHVPTSPVAVAPQSGPHGNPSPE
jgi:hypothetical protein